MVNAVQGVRRGRDIVSNIPDDVIDVINVLRRHGFSAYIVGGAVRDLVMGKEPKDYDIATNARPDEVMDLFRRAGWTVIPKGVAYGVVSVLHPRTGREIEIATFRHDIYDFSSRRPKVTYGDTIEEDLARRDFTINAMALDINGNIIDPFGGLKDLSEGVIRFVGDPYLRIKEDPLRILRALRFALRYGFRIDDETRRAVSTYWPELSRVSNERIGDEIHKMLSYDRFYETPLLLYSTNVYRSDKVLPELGPMAETRHDNRGGHYGETILQHTVDVGKRLAPYNPVIELRYAAMLHDIAKPETVKRQGDKITFYGHDTIGAEKALEIIKERWRRPASLASTTAYIVRWHHWPLNASRDYNTPRQLAARAVAKHGQYAPLLLLHAYGDSGDRLYYAAFLNAQKMLATPKPLLTGTEIIKIYKVKPGPIVGQIKRKLYELQLKYNINDKKELIDVACRELGLCP